MEYEQFASKFQFSPQYTRFVGVERECFLTREGRIAPIAAEVIGAVGDPFRFGCELSACQLEERTPPIQLSQVLTVLQENETLVRRAEEELGFRRLYSEVGPADMPLDIYPDPSGRYQSIASQLPKEVLAAACRVIGVHVHVGMPDHETALRVYNSLIPHFAQLCEFGNGSFGERLSLYRMMAPRWKPESYESWEHFYEVAQQQGFAHDPKQCWSLIRISVHGTIEFRMFGSTASHERIFSWAEACHGLCNEALG
jgi:gamma-glutamyl:cysteine ligase YbdK (ATP-grasp superfamily)